MMRAGYHPAAGANTSNFRVGNPYVGLRIGDEKKLVSGLIGTRVALRRRQGQCGQPRGRCGERGVPRGFRGVHPATLTFRGALEVRGSGRTAFSSVSRAARRCSSIPAATQQRIEPLFRLRRRIGYEGQRALATVALTGRYLINPTAA